MQSVLVSAVVVWFVPRRFPYALYVNHLTSRAVPSAASVIALLSMVSHAIWDVWISLNDS